MNYPEKYYRNLPHIQPRDGEFFVTYTLANSIPKHIIINYLNDIEILKNNKKLKDERVELFINRIENSLHSSQSEYNLNSPEISKIIKDSLTFYNKKYYDLLAYCIMSNHVHVVINCKNFKDISLSKLFGSIKGFSSYKINKVLNRNGKFWASEIYDHLIRNRDELKFYLDYTINNPVKAKLVTHYTEWKDSFIKPGLLNY